MAASRDLTGLVDGLKGRYLLALSGGPDSVALFHLLLQGGVPFEAAHFEHGVRGGDSVTDMDFVLFLCEENGVHCHVKRAKGLKEARGNFHDVARKERYQWMGALAAERELDGILTGHHRGDSRETFLLQAVRGSGVKGLGQPGASWSGVPVIHPLADSEKAELLDFLKAHGHSYRVDASNAQLDYRRNFIRHEVLVRLEKEYGSLEGLNRTIDHLSTQWHDLNAYYQELLVKSLVQPSKAEGELQTNAKQREAQVRALMLHLALPLIAWKEVVSLFSSQKGKWCMVGNYRFTVHGDGLIFSRSRTGDVQISIDGPGQFEGEGIQVVVQEMQGHMEIPSDTTTICLPEHTRFPLTLRRWQQGDRMQPFGMDGTKLVSDILSEAKMDLFTKERVLVVEDSDGELIWVVGLRNAEKCRVEEGGKRYFTFKIYAT